MTSKKKHLAIVVAAVIAGTVHAGDVSVSGFLTAAGGLVDDKDQGAVAGYSEEDLIFDADTLIGLQVSSNVSDKVTVTTQLVGRGAEDYEVNAEWAYLSYRVNDNFQSPMGR